MSNSTVKICHSKSKTGYAVICESDFDSKKHKLFDAKPKKAKKSKKAK